MLLPTVIVMAMMEMNSNIKNTTEPSRTLVLNVPAALKGLMSSPVNWEN